MGVNGQRQRRVQESQDSDWHAHQREAAELYAFVCLVNLSNGRRQVLPFGHHEVQVSSGPSRHCLDAEDKSSDYVDVSAACGGRTRSSIGMGGDGFR